MAAGGCHIVVAIADDWCWWRLSSPSDDAGVVVNAVDARGCLGLITSGGSALWYYVHT